VHAALHCLAVFVVLALARGALLAQAAASIPFLAPKQLRIDGALSDWSFASWQRVGDDPKGRAEVALAYDDSSLFIAARVFDDAFVRSPQPGPSEDALVLALELRARAPGASSCGCTRDRSDARGRWPSCAIERAQASRLQYAWWKGPARGVRPTCSRRAVRGAA